MNISGKKIIIFGGTSGIGEAATKIMSEKGAAEIIAISRNPDKMTNVPKNVNLKKIDVLDTRYVNNEIIHVLENISNLSVDDEIECKIDWERRFNIMQVHTTLHLLCSLISAPVTGGQINENKGRLDFDLESKPNKEEILEGLNNLIKQNYEVSISSISETELDEKPDLVRTMAVQPPRGKGEIRMIDIGKGVDYQPCGGTHVNNTSEIREVKKIKVENKGRMNKRVIVDFL